MTHKIKVQMFGNFRMDYNGAPFVAEKMHKESQFNRMMQALIHYSDCGIAKDKLEEIVIGERDIDAPHTALRVIVYKTKQKLAQLGLPGKNLIYLEGGIYYWTPDIEIEEDAAEFENTEVFTLYRGWVCPMIFITDELGKFEKNIIELAENMGFKECKTIEAIDLFCGISEKNDVLKEKDRYYAFIDIPQYWSVRADGLNGAIYDNKTKKANIYFKNPIEKRMVSRVEWIDRNNTVYRIDYYNKYGYMYCSENVSGGNVTVREFYDRNGDIKVLEQTGPKTYTTFGTRISPKSYRGFADYLEAYLKYNKIYDENIWLTSDEILNKFAWDYGNFKISYLPQNRLNSDLTVITQTNTAFRILCSEEQQVNWYKENSNYKCDRVYSYFENNELKFGKKEALTITESDQLEYIEQLINDFPEITFHIAASTIMSDKLTRLDINNNVELYPCITEQKRKELFERCDIYLDINHYRELYNAVNEAMVNNMIILAFDNTAHSKELYPMGNIFESSNYVKMKETLKNIITSQTIFNEYIDRQKKQLKQLAAKVVMGDTDESI